MSERGDLFIDTLDAAIAILAVTLGPVLAVAALGFVITASLKCLRRSK